MFSAFVWTDSVSPADRFVMFTDVRQFVIWHSMWQTINEPSYYLMDFVLHYLNIKLFT